MATPHLKTGAIALRIHLFGTAEEMVEEALAPPWPRSIRRLYELESLAEEAIEPDAGEVTVSAAISAVDTLLHHRLSLIAWAVAAMEELGWDMLLDGADVLASRVTAPEAALLELEDHGILGPLSKVCELDENGAPVFLSAEQIRRGGGRSSVRGAGSPRPAG
jgi:hypothetical protein